MNVAHIITVIINVLSSVVFAVLNWFVHKVPEGLSRLFQNKKTFIACLLSVCVLILTVSGFGVYTKVVNMPPKDETEAFAWYLDKVETASDPDPVFVNALGESYLYGRGTNKNYNMAFSRFLQAAGSGYLPAQYNLGLCYTYAYGTEVDDRKALAYFQAAEKEVPDAEAFVGYFQSRGWGGLEADKDKGHELLVLAQERGSAVSLYFQALCLLSEPDNDSIAQASELAQKALDAGYEKAYGPLGLCCVASDPEKAFYYFENGETVGDDISLCQLGICYQDGIAVDPDDALALEYFQRANAMGNAEASYRLGDRAETEEDYAEAHAYYTNASERGHGLAAYELGRLYQYGDGCTADEKKAFQLYQMASDQGIIPAQMRISMCYKDGIGIPQDQEKALSLVISLADNPENASAMWYAGYFYEHGIGMEKPDLDEAKKWYQKAISQGNPIAQNNLAWLLYGQQSYAEAFDWFQSMAQSGEAEAQYALGEFFFYGLGNLAQDYEQAKIWYEKAAAQDHCGALVQLGNIYAQDLCGEADPEKAFNLYKQAVALEYSDGQYHLAEFYMDGIYVDKNPSTAFDYYEKAAQQGHTQAQEQVARMLFYGDGVPKDSTTAVTWLTKAAENNSSWAQVHLGFSYDRGIGIPEDDEMAAYWYQRAADWNNSDGQLYLGFYYYCGRGGLPTDKEEAVRLYTLAADQGHSSAKYYLGMCYVEGEGVAQDYEKALELFTSAAEQNDPGSLYMLGQYYENGWSSVEVDTEKAAHYYALAEENGYIV